MTHTEFLRWFSGFLDGEGSFSIRFHLANSSYIKVGQYITINMTIDDLPILNKIKNRLGGYIKNTREAFGNWKAQRAWEVSKFDDCWDISVQLLEFPLQSKKKKDFDLFFKGLQIIQNKRKRGWKAHWKKEELLRIAKIRDRMNRKGGGKRGYRDYKAIEEICQKKSR